MSAGVRSGSRRAVVRPRLTAGYLFRFMASVVVYYSGLVLLLKALRGSVSGPRVRILAYHGFRDGLPYIELFLPPVLFREQVKYLRGAYDLMSLTDYLAIREGRRQLTRDSVVITMDDGYSDNFDVALPLCREFGVPMTVFATTDNVSGQTPTFVAALILAINATTRTVIGLPQYGMVAQRLGSLTEKEAAIREIDGIAKGMAPAGRAELLNQVLKELNVDPRRAGLDRLMLSWSQLREMQHGGMEIGSHTRSHPVLSQLDDDEIRDEITESLDVLEKELGQRPTLFAYPYGGGGDFDDRAERACAASGIRAAVTLVRQDPGDCTLLRIGRDMMTVDRCATPWGAFSRALFACEISGLMDAARNGLRSVA
jgi:peptidoglycan/xylan/chitin deacetylase (PgdA/CDA1 family)